MRVAVCQTVKSNGGEQREQTTPVLSAAMVIKGK